jgi:uncharacterized membrane protein YfcA
MTATIIPVALAVGLMLGLLGGGGSILMVPALVYVLGVAADQAIATSLLVVGATSAMGVVAHARAGRVRWKTGALFGAGGMAGAYLGGRIAGFIPPAVLLVAFAAIMLATAIAMLVRGSSREVTPHHLPGLGAVGGILADGVVVGLITGLVGAGGGFLVVPALVLLGGLTMADAIGTSLLVIALKSATGLWGHLSHVNLNWELAGAATALAMVGTLIGARVARRIHPDRLQRFFGWFVLTIGLLMLLRELPGLVH